LTEKYYTSIFQCPIYSWEVAKETGNFEFLRKKNLFIPRSQVRESKSNNGQKAFLMLLNEIFEEIGIHDEIKATVELKEELLNVNLEFAITGERFLLNQIKILKAEIEKKETNLNHKVSFSKDFAEVSKNSNGVIMDPKTTTIYQYLTIRETLTNG
jgi:hypothetical protein